MKFNWFCTLIMSTFLTKRMIFCTYFLDFRLLIASRIMYFWCIKLFMTTLLDFLNLSCNKMIHFDNFFWSTKIILVILRSVFDNSSIYHFNAMSRKLNHKLFFTFCFLLIIVIFFVLTMNWWTFRKYVFLSKLSMNDASLIIDLLS